MTEIKKYNVSFLVDNPTPTKLILLKRASGKSYAPNYYTGIGGKIGDIPGLENETPLESSYRELSEETLGAVTRENITLKEFARCVYDDGLTLYYFWGKYTEKNPPSVNPEDGSLIWVKTSDLFSHKIIPTTEAVCREWEKRGFKTDDPFTVFLKHTGMKDTIRLVEVIKVENFLR